MKKLRKLSGFTLIETVITTVIMAILIWVVFETYVIIWRIAVFIQLQKWIHNEVIYITQVVQNLVDNQNIVLTWIDLTQLSATNGFKSDLELVDDEFKYTFERVCGDDWCYIELDKRNIIFDELIDVPLKTALTNVTDIEVNQFVVKMLPYEQELTFTWTMHDWFWLFMDVEAPQYSEENWWYRVNYQWQLFFNPRKY